MELSAYLRLLRRWLWLIILAAVIAGSASFANARTQPPQYTASTTIQIGTYLGLSDPNPSMIQSAAALAQTYITLLRTTPVLESVTEKLQLPMSPGGLSQLFEAQVIQGTSFLRLSVTYTDPVIAADIANELAARIIENSPTELTEAQQRQVAILQAEIEQLQKQLQAAREELAIIDGALEGSPEQDQAILTARRVELLNEINIMQGNLASMSSTVLAMQQRGTINFLRVVEPARIPTSASNPSPLSTTLVAAAVGAVLAIGAAFLVEYLNDSLRSPAEVMPLLNVPLLGSIAPFGGKRSYKNKLITWTDPRSTISEAYRSLRVNILFRENNSPEPSPACRLYAVTSPGPAEGKSVTTANLAVTFAITGMRVLVIDADMRRPALHNLFNLPNNIGLSNIWSREEFAKARVATSAVAVRGDGNATSVNLLSRNGSD